MGFFRNQKVDHISANKIGNLAIKVVGSLLSNEEQAPLFKAVDEFYSKTQLWPARGKSIEEIETYFVLLAKFLSIYVYENFKERISQDKLIPLSQSLITIELVSTLNSQKENPNSDLALRLSKIIINQELATQSSYIIAANSSSFFETEKAQVVEIIGLLENNQTTEAWNIMYKI